jgi:peptidoglycan hydrolase CwlO-like protein
MTTAKYLHALDTLYENQEIELKIKNTKLKEAEAEVQALRKELLMLNSQLSTMREEKEQYKQELQKALGCLKTRKRRRRTY